MAGMGALLGDPIFPADALVATGLDDALAVVATRWMFEGQTGAQPGNGAPPFIPLSQVITAQSGNSVTVQIHCEHDGIEMAGSYTLNLNDGAPLCEGLRGSRGEAYLAQLRADLAARGQAYACDCALRATTTVVTP